MAETWSAVADSLALAAAMSSADGTSGAAGTEMRGANGAVTAPAGAASVPMSTAAAHSTAALRPDPVKTICRNPEVIRLGGPDHGRAVPLVCSPAVPRLRELLHFSNSSHINNINHNSVIRREPSWRVAALARAHEQQDRRLSKRLGVLVRLVFGVRGRFQLERAVVGIEVGAQAGHQLVQQLVRSAGGQHAVLHHHVR